MQIALSQRVGPDFPNTAAVNNPYAQICVCWLFSYMVKKSKFPECFKTSTYVEFHTDSSVCPKEFIEYGAVNTNIWTHIITNINGQRMTHVIKVLWLAGASWPNRTALLNHSTLLGLTPPGMTRSWIWNMFVLGVVFVDLCVCFPPDQQWLVFGVGVLSWPLGFQM